MATPKTIKKIEGEGMPIFDKRDYLEENPRRGDLYVEFEIVFPAKMTSAQREKLLSILSQ